MIVVPNDASALEMKFLYTSTHKKHTLFRISVLCECSCCGASFYSIMKPEKKHPVDICDNFLVVPYFCAQCGRIYNTNLADLKKVSEEEKETVDVILRAIRNGDVDLDAYKSFVGRDLVIPKVHTRPKCYLRIMALNNKWNKKVKWTTPKK